MNRVDPRERTRIIFGSLSVSLGHEIAGDMVQAARSLEPTIRQFEEDEAFAAENAGVLAGILEALARTAQTLPEAAELHARAETALRKAGAMR